MVGPSYNKRSISWPSALLPLNDVTWQPSLTSRTDKALPGGFSTALLVTVTLQLSRLDRAHLITSRTSLELIRRPTEHILQHGTAIQNDFRAFESVHLVEGKHHCGKRTYHLTYPPHVISLKGCGRSHDPCRGSTLAPAPPESDINCKSFDDRSVIIN